MCVIVYHGVWGRTDAQLTMFVLPSILNKEDRVDR
jgi:hypothetical protein